MRGAADRAGWIAMGCALFLGFWRLGQGEPVPAGAWLAQEMMQRAWQKSARQAATPWPWGDAMPVARLSARNGEVDLIVLAGDADRTLSWGPRHVDASALPGSSGNAVIAGDRHTHFHFLQYVEVGEALVVETASGARHLYKVTSVDVVDSRRASLELDTEVAFLSLVTSYPFEAARDDSPLRYVVSARMLF